MATPVVEELLRGPQRDKRTRALRPLPEQASGDQT